MKIFIQRFGRNILSVLHGVDRPRFRGTWRLLAHVIGMKNFLWQHQVLLQDFKAYAGQITAQLRQAAEASALEQGRPLKYLHNSVLDKEAWARQTAKRDGPRARLDRRSHGRGELLVVRGGSQPRCPKTRTAWQTQHVPARLPLVPERDLRGSLYTKPAGNPAQECRRSAALSRKRRLLRAHGLVHKIANTPRYQLSLHGGEVIDALLAARQASVAKRSA